MIGDGKKHDHWNLAIETASVQIGVKIQLCAHEARPKAKPFPKIVRRQNAMVNALERDSVRVRHAVSSMASISQPCEPDKFQLQRLPSSALKVMPQRGMKNTILP